MANPLSDRGVSDKDYAAAVGTLVGEVGVGGELQDYQAIADVIANRLDDSNFASRYGGTIAAQTMRPSEFSAWSSKEKNANLNARLGFAAALDPKVMDSLPETVQDRVQLAKQAVNDVFNTGVARGITQGATFYDNPDVTAMLGTSGFHDKLDRAYGSTMIGEHRFTGPNFRPDQPFDPITYNGMLAAPPVADEPFFGDVGVPVGKVDYLGELPDISMPAVPVGQVDFGGYLPDISPSYDFSGITAGTAFDPLSSFTPEAPAAPNFDDMPGPSYPDISAGMYGPTPSVSMGYGQTAPDGISPVGPVGMGQAFGVDTGAYAPGYHAGLGEDPYSGVGPDFNAPSFDAWSNTDSQFSRAQDAALGMGLHSSDLNPEAIADRLNRELGPQTTPNTPQLATPSFDMQSAYAGDWADKLGTPQTAPAPTQTQAPQAPSWSDYHPQDFSNLSFATPQAPSVPAAPASLPSVTHETPDYAGLVGSTYGQGQPLGGFMDAMANPDIAANYGQPKAGSSLIGWGDKGLTVAGFQSPVDAIGSLFGRTPSPQTVTQPHTFGIGNLLGNLGGLFGGRDNGLTGAMVPNGLGGWRQADGLDAMSNPAIANRMQGQGFLGGLLGSFGNPFGGGGLFGGSEGYYGGGNNGPGSARGDGSYADKSGYSDNDPQGIL